MLTEAHDFIAPIAQFVENPKTKQNPSESKKKLSHSHYRQVLQNAFHSSFVFERAAEMTKSERGGERQTFWTLKQRTGKRLQRTEESQFGQIGKDLEKEWERTEKQRGGSSIRNEKGFCEIKEQIVAFRN